MEEKRLRKADSWAPVARLKSLVRGERRSPNGKGAGDLMGKS